MPTALVEPTIWETIKIANIRGATDDQLAAQFGVTEPSIRKRRSRDPVWAAAVSDRVHHTVHKAKIERVMEKAEIMAEELSQKTSESVTKADPVTVQTAIQASLEQIRERHPLRVASFIEKKVSRAIERDMLPELDNWKAFNTADAMLRRNLGLDKPQVAVQINTWSGDGGGMWVDESGTSLDVDGESDESGVETGP